MIRSLLVLDAVLVVILGGLWWLDRSFDEHRERVRTTESAFHAIADAETPPVSRIWRIELKLPGSDAVWVAERHAGGWRLPTYREALAVPDAVAGFLKSLLESHGLVAGSILSDGPRLGFVNGRTLDVRLFDSSGAAILHAVLGDVAPGQHGDECYVAIAGQDRILQIDANPWTAARPDPSNRFPPFTDTLVIPQVLGRSVPAKVTFSGPEAPAIGPIVRRDASMEEMQRTMGKGPRFHWFSADKNGERPLNDVAATTYLNGLSTLAFDDLVGPIKGQEEAFARPGLVITITYDKGETDVLKVGAKTPQGRVLLSNGTTRQAFVISPAKAAALHPDAKALLETQAESGPSSR